MKNKLIWLECFFVLPPFVLLMIYWRQIPERVPIHWNLAGQIDRWGPKEFGILLPPLISLGLVALLRICRGFRSEIA